MIAATGSGDVRVWFMQMRDGDHNAWNVWYRRSADAGATWSPRARLSDVTSGFAYVTRRGFREPYGDYGEIAITSTGTTIAVWGQGMRYNGPGGPGSIDSAERSPSRVTGGGAPPGRARRRSPRSPGAGRPALVPAPEGQ